MSKFYRRNLLVIGTSALIFSMIFFGCKLDEIPPLPTVEFTVLCGTITDGGDSCLMVFTNTSLYGDSYLWHFGDGTTSTTRVPENKKMLNNCSYSITLNVTNETGTAKHTQGITLGTATPVASFSTQGYPIAACDANETNCLGEPYNSTVAFINESSCAYRYEWTIENDEGSSDVLDDFEPIYEWCDSALYQVTLVAYGQDEFGSEIASDPFTAEVQVFGTSVTTCTTSDFESPHICETQGVGCTMPLTNNSTNAESYLWRIYNSAEPGVLYTSSEEESPSIFFQGSDEVQVDYDVYLTAHGVFNDDVAYEKVHILPNGNTSAIFHIDTWPDDIEGPLQVPCWVSFEENSVNADSWKWYFDGELFFETTDENNTTPPLFAIYSPGPHTFTLEVTGPGSNSITDFSIDESIFLAAANSYWECGDWWFDERDSTIYSTTDLNGECFMGTNLDFSAPGLDYVGMGPDFCVEGFRYYHWDAVEEACPEGWSIPTEDQLMNLFGSFSNPEPGVADLITGGSTGFGADAAGFWDGVQCGDGGISALFWAKAGDGTPRFWAFDPGSTPFWEQADGELITPWNDDVMLNIRCVKD